MMRTSLSDQAYERLRVAIVFGEISAETPLVETEIVALLGVSRTPVREALRRLELEGYLERDTQGRLVVRLLTETEVSEIFHVRTILEGFAARLAAARISDAELERMERLLEEDERALKRQDVDELARLNEELHDVVLEASRNRTLRDIVKTIRGRVYGLGLFAVGRPDDQRRFVDEHAHIVELLREGDGAALEDVVTEHLRAARDLLVEGLATTS